jgi:hypothetical protein
MVCIKWKWNRGQSVLLDGVTTGLFYIFSIGEIGYGDLNEFSMRSKEGCWTKLAV